MDYVKNVRLTPEMLDDKESAEQIVKQLGVKLQALHKGPNFTEKATSIFTDIEDTAKIADMSRVPPVATTVLETVRGLEKVLEKHQKSVPCHKDLHSNNVLFNGKEIFFIDWELGTNSDPFIDLACASMFFIFDSKNDELLLKTYFGREPTETERAHFFVMKQICLCAYGFRLLRRVCGFGKMDLSKETIDKSKLPDYKSFILKNYNGCSESFTNDYLKTFPYVFLGEALKNIESSQFTEAVKTLSK